MWDKCCFIYIVTWELVLLAISSYWIWFIVCQYDSKYKMTLHPSVLIRPVIVLEYISWSLGFQKHVRKLSGRQEIRCTRLTRTAFSAFIFMAILWLAKALFRSTAFAVLSAFLVAMRELDKLILPDTFKNKLSTGVENIPVQKGEKAICA